MQMTVSALSGASINFKKTTASIDTFQEVILGKVTTLRSYIHQLLSSFFLTLYNTVLFTLLAPVDYIYCGHCMSYNTLHCELPTSLHVDDLRRLLALKQVVLFHHSITYSLFTEFALITASWHNRFRNTKHVDNPTKFFKEFQSFEMFKRCMPKSGIEKEDC